MAESQVSIKVAVTGNEALTRLQQQMAAVDSAAKKAQGSVPQAANGIRSLAPASQAAAGGMQGLGAAIQAALGPILTVTTAIAVLKKGIDTAFERGAAEQKLKNFTDSAGEYAAALAVAADSSNKFGISQTEATAALADVYSRLKGLGFGLKETSEIYQGFNAIALESGTTAEDAAGAFLQLSQALGSGKLQGDELRAILERMPTLAQRIADSMGVSAAQIRQLGQDGKITSEVIYQALSESAAAADNFGSKLNAQQSAMKNLKQVADQLLNSIGQVFAPFVVAGAEALAAAGQKLADWWGYIGNVVFPKVYEAAQPVIQSLQAAFEDIDFDAIRVVMQSILIRGFEVLTGVVANFSKVLAVVIDSFKALSQNPVFQFIAEQVGRLAGFLGLTNDKVKEFKDEQEKVTEAAAGTLDQYSNLPPKVEDAKKAAKELKEEQEKVTKAIQEASTAADQLAQKQSSVVDQRLAVTQAYLQAEMQVNDVLLQQAQSQLQGARNQQERIQAAKAIYDLTVQQADLQYAATTAQIQAEVEKARIAEVAAQQKAKEVEAVVRLAAAQGVANAEHYRALDAIREAASLAQSQAATTYEVATQQERAARAVRDGAIAAADAQFQQNIVAKSTQTAAAASGEFASNMERAAAAASKTAASMSAVQGMSTASAVGANYDFGPAGQNAAFNAAYEAELNKLQNDQVEMFVSVEESQRKLNELNQQFFDAAASYNEQYWEENRKNMEEAWIKGGGGQLPGYASGGYVTGPQVAMIGEGGESEYVIPSSKMASAMANYAAGKRGNAVLSSPQVNITTGPVTQMNGTNYVTQQDLMASTQSAVNQTLSLLRSNPSVRRSVGVSR